MIWGTCHLVASHVAAHAERNADSQAALVAGLGAAAWALCRKVAHAVLARAHE